MGGEPDLKLGAGLRIIVGMLCKLVIDLSLQTYSYILICACK